MAGEAHRIDHKRAKFQHVYAEDAISLEDLKARLAELDELRALTQRELEALRHHEEEIARLGRDRDALLESYAATAPEALDSLPPEEHHTLYIDVPIGSFRTPRRHHRTRAQGSAKLRRGLYCENDIEISVLVKQCLRGRRPGSIEELCTEVEAWQAERNRQGASADWRFTTPDALA